MHVQKRVAYYSFGINSIYYGSRKEYTFCPSRCKLWASMVESLAQLSSVEALSPYPPRPACDAVPCTVYVALRSMYTKRAVSPTRTLLKTECLYVAVPHLRTSVRCFSPDSFV
jgi:hypothetical protein